MKQFLLGYVLGGVLVSYYLIYVDKRGVLDV